MNSSVRVEQAGAVRTIIISRPERRNAVDGPTASVLAAAFREFEADTDAKVAVLYGEGGHFCAGADLKALSVGNGNHLAPDGDGPMGPTRMHLQKPLIAAISGYAVAGGLELALLADLRVADEDATMGVFCRRFGVPLIDGGTVRLPRVVGLGRALDLILTGRSVGAAEALTMGLVNRVVPSGTSRQAAEALANTIASFPEACMRSDRTSTYEALDEAFAAGMAREFAHGMRTIASGETGAGAERFVRGAGRHGSFE